MKAALCRLRFAFIVCFFSSRPAKVHLNQWSSFRGPPHIQVIEQARKRTEAFYRAKGRDQTWAVFLQGCYLPLYVGAERPSDAELARRHGLDSARQASNTITTAKRCFGDFLREVVRTYEKSDCAVDGEIRELIAIVSDGH
ncbi:MAG: hypothetical protein IT579_07815 [Verrucomicrobia subdivision 3 bacterium]|nr:hypothetical protein [Limisphaerales bacterium]